MSTATGGFGGNFSGSEMGRGGFGMVSTISSSSISVKNTRTGDTTTYTITSSTIVTDNGLSSSVSAIQTGDMVIVRTANPSSIIATRIMLNPTTGTSPSASGSATTGGSATEGE